MSQSKGIERRWTRVLLAVLVACTVGADRAAAAWQSIGPYGGTLGALAVDPQTPSTLYAGTTGGVFKSGDAGSSWSPASSGLSNAPVAALAVDPATPSRLYAATAGAGVFKSVDAAASWSAVNGGISNLGAAALALDPSAPATVYVGTLGGVFKSTDAGGIWSERNSGLTNLDVRALVVHPSSPSTLYAGTAAGVFKTTDGGDHWSQVSNGLTSLSVRGLSADPLTPATLYAATTGGVFKTTDGAANWSPRNAGLTSLSLRALAIDPLTPTRLYAGASSGGVFQSTNAGDGWSPVNSGLGNLATRALAIDPLTPTRLYAGTAGGGVFRSSDAAANWAVVNQGLSNLTVAALAGDPTEPDTLYAGTSGNGVLKTANGGTSWSAASSGITNLTIRALVALPAVQTTLYAGTAAGLFKTTNAATSWSSASNGITNTNIRALAVLPSAPATLYAGTAGGVFKTTNGGALWVAVNTGLTNLSIAVLAIDPSAPATLYAGTAGGVFKTTNGGTLWAAVNSGLANLSVAVLAIDPSAPATLYAGTAGSVFKTTNGGASWSPANGGMLNVSVGALTASPTASGTLHAGSVGNGVFETSDGGANWTALNGGLPDLVVPALAIDPFDPARLYAGTGSRSAFALNQVSVCGNGSIELGEVCDDEGTQGGDGCSASCQVEAGFTCNGEPSVCTAIPVAPPGSVGGTFGSLLSPSFTRIAGLAGDYVDSVAAADADGDGRSEVIVGVELGADPDPAQGELVAALFPGAAGVMSDTGFADAPTQLPFGAIPVVGWLDVCSANDVNGDGYQDLLVGVPHEDGSATDEGAAFVYQGSAQGISSAAAPATRLSGGLISGAFGGSVAAAGDVNGDGYDDVLVGAPAGELGVSATSFGAAYVFHGLASGIPDGDRSSASAAVESDSGDLLALIGSSLSGAGDLDGDGFDDVLIGAPRYGQPASGAAFALLGSSTGIVGTTPEDAGTQLSGGSLSSGEFGNPVAAGDFDGDGYGDLAVADPDFGVGGRVAIFRGGATGIPDSAASAADTLLSSSDAGAAFGRALATGDLDGDGHAELIVGASDDQNLSGRGRLYVFRGRADGIPSGDASSASSRLTVGQGLASFAGEIASGDVNGDGGADVIVHAAGELASDHDVVFVLYGIPDRDGDGLPDGTDRCPHYASANQVDTDGNGRGDVCECGDVNLDGSVNVSDIVAVNLCLFAPLPKPQACLDFCDANGDGLCSVSDIVAVNQEIFSAGASSTCSRQPVAGP